MTTALSPASTMSIQTMLKIARNHSHAECGSVTTMAAKVSMRRPALHFGWQAASTAIGRAGALPTARGPNKGLRATFPALHQARRRLQDARTVGCRDAKPVHKQKPGAVGSTRPLFRVRRLRHAEVADVDSRIDQF